MISAALGQTKAALKIATKLPDKMKSYHISPKARGIMAYSTAANGARKSRR